MGERELPQIDIDALRPPACCSGQLKIMQRMAGSTPALRLYVLASPFVQAVGEAADAATQMTRWQCWSEWDDTRRYVPMDERCRMVQAELERAIAQDRGAGLLPRLAIASAGTTGVGAIDPLEEIGRIANGPRRPVSHRFSLRRLLHPGGRVPAQALRYGAVRAPAPIIGYPLPLPQPRTPESGRPPVVRVRRSHACDRRCPVSCGVPRSAPAGESGARVGGRGSAAHGKAWTAHGGGVGEPQASTFFSRVSHSPDCFLRVTVWRTTQSPTDPGLIPV